MRLSVRRAVASALARAGIALVVFVAGRAAAETPTVLFVSSSSTPFGTRVRAEIEAMGFSIEPSTSLDDAPSTADAVAAVRVVDGPSPRAELWIADPTTHRLGLRSAVALSTHDDDATETVRVSEELRAFFQPLRQSTAPAEPPNRLLPPAPIVMPPPRSEAPPAAPPLPLPPSPVRFAASANLTLALQPGGPGVDLGVSGRWIPTPLLGVGAFVDVPLAGSTVKGPQGTASVAAPLFGAELAVLVDLTPRVRLAPSAALALAWIRTSGFAKPPFHGRPSDVTAALPLLGGDLGVRVTDRAWLTAGGRVGFSLPRTDIAFAGENVAVWGRPLGLVSAGVSVDF